MASMPCNFRTRRPVKSEFTSVRFLRILSHETPVRRSTSAQYAHIAGADDQRRSPPAAFHRIFGK